MPFDPRYLILHDYGQLPSNHPAGKPLGFNPYHALVSGGKVQYRYPDNPYGQKAPHAYRLNPQSLGLAWAGPVGGQPGPEDLEALRAEIARIKAQYPSIQLMSHGEAYAKRGQLPQASKLGRGLDEAAWRKALEADFRANPSAPVPSPQSVSRMVTGPELGQVPPAAPVDNRAMAAALQAPTPPPPTQAPQQQDPVIRALLDQWTYGAKA